MSPSRILIVEDEFIIAQALRRVLEGLGYGVSGHAFDAVEAMDILQGGGTDLAIVDISLSGKMDGIELGHLIRARHHLPILFLTSHSDPGTISRAKDVHPAGYLVKPFNQAEIFAAIEIALANRPTEPVPIPPPDHVFVKVGSTMKRVAYGELTFLKADRIYVEIHRKEGLPLVVRESLNVWEEKLPQGFLRVNRSYILNLAHVEAVGTHSVTVGGREVSVSRAIRDHIIGKMTH